MDAGKMTAAVIIGVVMLLIVTVVVIPVLGSATYTTVPGYNDPDAYVTTEIPSGEYTVSSSGYSIDGGAAVPVANNEWFLMSSTLIIYKSSDTAMAMYDTAKGPYVATLVDLTIDSVAGTYSGTTSSETTITGSIGDGARLVVAASSETGVYDSGAFSVNGDDTIYGYLHTRIVTIDGTSCNLRAEVSGTVDDLTVTKALLTGKSEALDASAVTVTFATGSISNDGDVYTIAANPVLNVTFTYDGDSYTTSTLFDPYFAGPTTYTTHVDSTIKNLVDIVPLLMVVGVIVMIISVAVLRR